MASAAYTPYKESLLGTGATRIDLDTDTIKAVLLRVSSYTFSAAHQFYTDLTSPVQVSDGALTTPVLTGGVFDADDTLFTAVPAGAAIDCLAIFKDTGVAATSPLICYLDGFSVTPNGGNITVQWSSGASRIFRITG